MYRVIRPLLFSLPAETSHNLTIRLLRGMQGTPLETVLRDRYQVTDDRLAVDLFGQKFPRPVGVAAGFDKNGHVPRALAALGFGHVEIGGVTANQQAGNSRPRLFRLPADRAIINRMGFNNDGAETVAQRLAQQELPAVPVGVNLGKSKQTPMDEAATDYAKSYDRLAPYGDFFVVNVSSPNTPELRDLQAREPLERVLTTLLDRSEAPLLVKLSPDLSTTGIEAAVDLAEELGLAGIVATNTTTDRPDSLRDDKRTETGGLSGAPLEHRSTELVARIATQTDLPVIGVGGVFTAEDAYQKIRAGASLVQLYTGLIYRGPGIARSIHQGLIDHLDRDGFSSLEKAIGVDL